MIPKWFNVNADAQIWSGHANEHKQFVLRAPAGILAIEEYQGSYRFKMMMVNDSDGNLIQTAAPLDPQYPETWIRIADVTTEPYEEDDDGNGDVPPPDNGDPPPIPEPDAADAELGAALKTLGRFVQRILHGVPL